MKIHVLNATSSALRAEPDHGAEQISRLLLGESFRKIREVDEGRWVYGAGPDDYEGWIRSWHLQDLDEERRADRSVTARWSRALSEAREGAEILLDLSFGTRLFSDGPEQAGHLPCRLPDGRPAWIPAADMEPLGGGAKEIIARGRRLLGVPYEWGGRSSGGLDCSGFLQLLFASAGIALPRDAWQQAEEGEPLSMDEAESWLPGDLLFYGPERVEHVGLWLGDHRLLHASGTVRIEVLDPGGRLPGPDRPAPAACRRLLPRP